MRQKQLVQNRLRKLQGQLKKLDMNIHRGGSRTTINESQRDVEETVQDIVDKVCRVMTAKNGEKVTHLNYATILNRPEEDQIDIEFEPE